MHNPVMAHQGQRGKHLTSEPSNEGCGESDEAVRLDELVEVDAQEFHGDTKMTTEIEVFSHLDHMVFLFGVLNCVVPC